MEVVQLPVGLEYGALFTVFLQQLFHVCHDNDRRSHLHYFRSLCIRKDDILRKKLPVHAFARNVDDSWADAAHP